MNPYEQAISGRRLDLGANPGVMTNMTSGDIVLTGFEIGSVKAVALDCDGSDDYVEIPNAVAVGITNNLSAVIWVNMDSTATNDGMMAFYTADADQRSWLIATGSSDARKLRIICSDDGTSNVANKKDWTSTNQVLPASGWTMVTMTFASGTLKAYVGATEVASWTKTTDAAITSLHASTGPLTISRDPANAGWTGKLCNASLWSTAVLAQADVTALYNSGTPIDPRDLSPSGSQNLVGAWLWNDKLTYPNIKDNVVRT